jgi:hypothetical protein
MAASLIQPAASNNASPGSTFQSSLAYASNVSAGGSTLVGAFAAGSSTQANMVVHDNINGGWQQAGQAFTSNGNIFLFYMQNANPGATTVTCTWGGSAGALRIALQEWGGFTAVPLDRNGTTSGTTGSTTTPSVGPTSIATQYPNSVTISAIGGASGTPTITAAGGATLDFQTVGRIGIEYETNNTNTTVSGAFGYASSDFAAIVVATFIVSPANISMPYLS